MPIPDDQAHEDTALNERLMDLFVFVPAGIALSVVEDFPKLAARGREKLGTRVTSARAIGQFAVKAGADEFRRRSEDLLHRSSGPPAAGPSPTAPPASSAETPVTTTSSVSSAASTPPSGATARPASNAHIPAVGTLSIPGFDTLSASQVVQRLDGLNRTELVSVRAYESQTRGRRTILSRVDQLLDERS